jgi:hypothetical protein
MPDMHTVRRGIVVLHVAGVPNLEATAYRNLAEHGVAAAGLLRLCRRDLVVAGAQFVEDGRLLPLELARHLEGEACHLRQPHIFGYEVRLCVTAGQCLCRALQKMCQAGPPAMICMVHKLALLSRRHRWGKLVIP